MNSDDEIRLRHMLESAEDALRFAAPRSRSDLDVDRQLVLAVVKCVEIIGEAANSVSREFRSEHPAIPWHQISGMRNRLIHAYYDINLDVVWSTVREDLPALIRNLKKLLPA